MKKTWWCVIDTDKHGVPQPEQVTIDRLEVRPMNPQYGGIPRGVSPDMLSDTPQGALDAAVEQARSKLGRCREQLKRADLELGAVVRARDAFAKLGGG